MCYMVNNYGDLPAGKLAHYSTNDWERLKAGVIVRRRK